MHKNLSKLYRNKEINMQTYEDRYWDDVWESVSKSKYGKHFKYTKENG